MTAKPPSNFITFQARMNLLAASKRLPQIYVAHEDKIGVMPIPSGEGLCDLPSYDRILNRPFPDDGSKGYILAHYVYLFAT